MAWGLLMPSNTEHDRRRTHLASVLRLLFVPVALLVSFHTESASADSPSVVLLAAASENAAVEPPLCDLADRLLAVAPGFCAAVTPEVVTREAQEEAAKAPADQAPASKAAPMCATDATSISAPVEIPEVDGGHFEPLPCDGQAVLSLLRSWPREGSIQLTTARESPPRVPLQSPALNDGNDGIGALSMPLDWPERPAPSTLAAYWSGGLARQPGHRSRIDRPPSPRA
jgi:hypothetical protein